MSDNLTALEKAQQKLREMRAAGIKPEILNPVEKAQKYPKSLSLAVKAHCWVCVGGDADSGGKLRVKECGVLKCMLHPHRPWQKLGESSHVVVANDGEVVDAEDLLEDSE